MVNDCARVAGAFSGCFSANIEGPEIEGWGMWGAGAWSTGSKCKSSETVGKGGRKSGICSGGSQLDVRGRFRGGEDGLDMGDKGNGGVEGREGGRLAPTL